MMPIQIAVTERTLLALMADGSIYEYSRNDGQWYKLPDGPWMHRNELTEAERKELGL